MKLRTQYKITKETLEYYTEKAAVRAYFPLPKNALVFGYFLMHLSTTNDYENYGIVTLRQSPMWSHINHNGEVACVYRAI